MYEWILIVHLIIGDDVRIGQETFETKVQCEQRKAELERAFDVAARYRMDKGINTGIGYILKGCDRTSLKT